VINVNLKKAANHLATTIDLLATWIINQHTIANTNTKHSASASNTNWCWNAALSLGFVESVYQVVWH